MVSVENFIFPLFYSYLFYFFFFFLEFDYFDHIKYPTFTFGGVKGQTISTVAFKPKKKIIN